MENKRKQIEQKSKIDKEVVQLKYKGNQKQFELNAELDAIIENIETECGRCEPDLELIKKHTQEARQLIRKRQKLIKIADKSKDGWQVVAEYESDELASGSEDEKRLKKASREKRQAESGARRTNSLVTMEIKQELLLVLTISFFVVRTSACILLCEIMVLDPRAYTPIFLV